MTGTDAPRTGPTPDLFFQDEIHAMVRDAYRAIPAGAGRAVTGRFYETRELEHVPDEALRWALGVGDPVRHAGLRAGEVVLDLGCGSGIDLVLAARAVGPTGRVLGLDMLPEMRDRAAVAAQDAGVAAWCEVLVGQMEAIPIPDASVDVIVSNGVLNLSPRKSRAVAEMARVLRPGGRLCIADLVIDRDLPPEVLASEAAWAGCIAGAVSERVLVRKLQRADFTGIGIGHQVPLSLDDIAAYPLFTPEVVELMRRLLTPEAQDLVATGVIVQAHKPIDPPHRSPIGATPTGVTALDDIEPGASEAPGVTVRPLKSVEDVQLKVLDIAPGASTPYHSHAHAHEGVVIAGRGVLHLADRREPLAAGDVFTVNPAAPHAISSEGDREPLRFVCMDCFIE